MTAGRGVPPARAAARAARRRSRRRLLRAAGAEGAGRRGGARRPGAARRRRAMRCSPTLDDGWLRDQVHGLLRPTRACSPARRSRTATRSRAATACGRSERRRPRLRGSARRARRAAAGRRRVAERRQAWRERHAVPATRRRRARRAAAAACGCARRLALVDLPAGRGGRGSSRCGRAVVGVQLLPRRPAQPRRAEHRRTDDRPRPDPPRRARGVPGPPHRDAVKEQLLDPRPGSHRGIDPDGPDAAAGPERGHRRDRRRHRARRRPAREEAYAILRRHGVELADPERSDAIADAIDAPAARSA